MMIVKYLLIYLYMLDLFLTNEAENKKNIHRYFLSCFIFFSKYY